MFDTSAIPVQLRAMTASAAATCLLLAGMAYSERNEILAAKDQPAMEVYGVLQVLGKHVVVKADRSVLLDCSISVCGYRDIALDSGKQMTFSLAQGRIVRTKDGNSMRDIAAEQANHQAAKAWVYSLVAALLAMTFTYLLRRHHASQKKSSLA